MDDRPRLRRGPGIWEFLDESPHPTPPPVRDPSNAYEQIPRWADPARPPHRTGTGLHMRGGGGGGGGGGG